MSTKENKIVPVKELDLDIIFEFIIVLEGVDYELQIEYVEMIKALKYEVEEELGDNHTIRSYQGIKVDLKKKKAIIFGKLSDLYFPQEGKIYLDGQVYSDKILTLLTKEN